MKLLHLEFSRSSASPALIILLASLLALRLILSAVKDKDLVINQIHPIRCYFQRPTSLKMTKVAIKASVVPHCVLTPPQQQESCVKQGSLWQCVGAVHHHPLPALLGWMDGGWSKEFLFEDWSWCWPNRIQGRLCHVPGLVSVSRSKVARVQRHQAAQLLVAELKYTDNFNINHETKCSW